jgi:hypothetical protein
MTRYPFLFGCMSPALLAYRPSSADFFNQGSGAPRSPAAIHFPRQTLPDFLVRDSFPQVIEERFVYVAGAGFDQVIRVGDETSGR